MNPLLSTQFRLPFDEVKAEHVESGIQSALKSAQTALDELIKTSQPLSYSNTLAVLEDLLEPLGQAVTMAYHLTSVATSPELREAFNKVLPEYSAFYAKMPLNQDLWQLIKRYAETPDAKALTGVHKRHLEETLKNFKRAGADLSEDKKARVEAIKVELSQLQTKFSENILDATNSFELLVQEESKLDGLPDLVKAQAKANAEAKDLSGYRFTLQIPSFLPFMKNVHDQTLRKELHEAYANRASDGDFDNRPLIPQILRLRQELAELLGYQHFADYRLEEAMVGSGSAALSFEEDLFEKTLPYWHEERSVFEAFAKDELGIDPLNAWDVAYVQETLRKAKFDFDDEALRPYFPLKSVLSGMFDIAQKLFGIVITEQENKKVWHEDVKYFDIHDSAGQHIASFYADLFPREDKRSGAWMNNFITGNPAQDRPHLGFIAANFTPPQNNQEPLITHDEVTTTFHEFGHLLHHCLSRVEVRSLAGTHVPWDFVELPSQIMENWAWEREALDMFARHHKSNNVIPEALYQKMLASRTFMQGNHQMRQLSFGSIDLSLHTSYNPEQDGDPISYANHYMEKYAIRPEFAHNNFLAAFGHVFSGGYAASYYSYKWSEVLDADAFSRFKKEGIFNPQTGQAFVNNILAQGNSKDAAELYKDFMGREPDVNALLERNLGQAPQAERVK